MYRLFNHQTSSLSELDLEMIRHVPAGGNWRDIPASIPSKRLEQIRKSGGRTTYYGRLRWDAPAYTINTYFNRPGNGTFIHPDDGSDGRPPQHRLISFREAARLQSFPDRYRFYGPKSSLLKQIGNAVPPLLAYAVARQLDGETVAEVFAGAGGMSLGFALAGFAVLSALDIDRHAMTTYGANHPSTEVIVGDILDPGTREQFVEETLSKLGGQDLDGLIGGPPCQGFSTAGWRRADDPRNRLWVAYMWVLEALRPRWFVLENVPGMASMKARGAEDGQIGGRLTVLDVMIRAFRDLGYRLDVGVLNAVDFGVPQRRKRLFVIGTRDDQRQTYTLPRPLVERPLTVRDAIGNLPPLGVNDGKEELVLRELPPRTLYQSWVQGEIGVEDLIQVLSGEAGAAQVPLFV
ncbi:DNA (cytosine-5-)-methyltransferase [Thermus sp. SYSU G05001]|uniref:Cytosine-specific methyltransferase n=1 Tax=Thermus brevis TaxID=2862456 RepID=A0ABS7A171_9DEIN|nr:DNA (cytosine-5-)-methyltransferase [Thermus brevis]MBW6396041.1 DNA (cytosine-5-)-methyltransferase [Thermus brevis]